MPPGGGVHSIGYDWQASRTRIKDQLFGVSTNVLVCHWLTSRVYGVTCPPPPAQVLYLPLLLRTLPSTFVFHMSMSALNEPLKVMEPELPLRFRVPWRQESFSSPPCSPTFTQPLPRQA